MSGHRRRLLPFPRHYETSCRYLLPASTFVSRLSLISIRVTYSCPCTNKTRYIHLSFSLQINALLAHYGYDSIAFNQLEEETWYNQEKFQTWIEDVRRATDPLHSASSSPTATPIMRTILLGLDGRRRTRNLFDIPYSTSTNPLSVTIPPSTCTSMLTTPSTFPNWSNLLPYYHMMFPDLSSYSTIDPTTSVSPSCGSSSTYTRSLPISTIPPNLSNCPPVSSSSLISSPRRNQQYSPLDPHRHRSSSLSRA